MQRCNNWCTCIHQRCMYLFFKKTKQTNKLSSFLRATQGFWIKHDKIASYSRTVPVWTVYRGLELNQLDLLPAIQLQFHSVWYSKALLISGASTGVCFVLSYVTAAGLPPVFFRSWPHLLLKLLGEQGMQEGGCRPNQIILISILLGQRIWHHITGPWMRGTGKDKSCKE